MMRLYLCEMGKELIEPSRILDIKETLRKPKLLNMQDRSVLVFDLDDTLYLERYWMLLFFHHKGTEDIE